MRRTVTSPSIKYFQYFGFLGLVTVQPQLRIKRTCRTDGIYFIRYNSFKMKFRLITFLLSFWRLD